MIHISRWQINGPTFTLWKLKKWKSIKGAFRVAIQLFSIALNESVVRSSIDIIIHAVTWRAHVDAGSIMSIGASLKDPCGSFLWQLPGVWAHKMAAASSRGQEGDRMRSCSPHLTSARRSEMGSRETFTESMARKREEGRGEQRGGNMLESFSTQREL